MSAKMYFRNAYLAKFVKFYFNIPVSLYACEAVSVSYLPVYAYAYLRSKEQEIDCQRAQPYPYKNYI